MMSFRASMAQELETIGCLDGGKLIYSMWPGYLDRSVPDLRQWATRNGMAFEVIHTSGHADAQDLRRLVAAVSPRRLVPIHTLAPDRFNSLGAKLQRISDGIWTSI